MKVGRPRREATAWGGQEEGQHHFCSMLGYVPREDESVYPPQTHLVFTQVHPISPNRPLYPSTPCTTIIIAQSTISKSSHKYSKHAGSTVSDTYLCLITSLRIVFGYPNKWQDSESVSILSSQEAACWSEKNNNLIESCTPPPMTLHTWCPTLG